MTKRAQQLVMATVLAACGGTAELDVDDDFATAESEMRGCPDVVLEASRSYGPARWNDDRETFRPAATVTIPAELQVVGGNAGNHFATLVWEGPNGIGVCRYRGGSRDERPRTRREIVKGLTYRDPQCTRRVGAGDQVRARSVTLHVDGGDRDAGRTLVRAVLPKRCPLTDRCAGLDAAALDDGNACTVDSCDPAVGPKHVPAAKGASCGDNDACNGAELCDGAGACTGGASVDVDDGNPCTVDSCDPATGAVHEPASVGTSCADANACNGAETCDGAGACVGGAAPDLDDANPCTLDGCDAATGPTHVATAAGSSCTDGDACNGLEACDGAGACQAGNPLVQDDGNPCTVDGCDPVLGTVFVPVDAGADCGDGNACNGAESCDGAGSCAAGVALVADDGNPCTADACDPVAGVTNAPVAQGAACGDGNLCNGVETCDGAGSCVAGAAPVVNDGNPCTTDSCDPASGVRHVAATGSSCADANVCNGAEVCDATGRCVAGAPAATPDDGNNCTVAMCDPVTGFSHVAVPAGTLCGVPDMCAGIPTCNGFGTCFIAPPPPSDECFAPPPPPPPPPGF